MNEVLYGFMGLGLLVLWYTLYNWIYIKIEEKVKINAWGNLFIITFTPIMAYCMIITMFTIRFLHFIEKDN